VNAHPGAAWKKLRLQRKRSFDMASRATALDPKTAGTKDPKSSVQPGAAQNAPETEIAALAYQLWQGRGCPIGSPEEDWFRAENELQIQGVAATK
jgi:hypothetical protein